MPHLTLNVLGTSEILLDGEPVSKLRSAKARALLFYIGLEPTGHTRSKIADLLWDEDSVALNNRRQNLRNALMQLRRHGISHIVEDGDLLRLSHTENVTVDGVEFLNTLQKAQLDPGDLTTLVGTFKNPLLHGLKITKAPRFNEWHFATQTHLNNRAMAALQTLVIYHAKQGHYRQAATAAERWEALTDTLPEPRQWLMVLSALMGKSADTRRWAEQCYAAYEHINTYADDKMVHLETCAEKNKVRELKTWLVEQTPPLRIEPPRKQVQRATAAAPFQAYRKPREFVGREDELNRCADWLREPHAVCALVGMGGIGKTTMATMLSHRLRDHFTDGVLWARLNESSVMSILSNWAHEFGVDVTAIPDLANRSARVRNLLSTKKVLLVLDDWVPDELSRDELERYLLPNGSKNSVLITTRDRASVRSLARRNIVELEVFSAAEGYELFSELVHDDRVELDPPTAKAVLELLENLPLAIRLAAQCFENQPRWSLQKLYKSLASVRDRIGNLALRTDRPSPIWIAFEQSWELLSAELQTTFARLAVFEGRAFDTAAVAAVIDSDNDSAETNLNILYAYSLVDFVGDGFRQHSLLASYASAKLDGETEPWVLMAEYFSRVFENNHYDLARLEPHWENIVAGAKAAFNNEMWDVVVGDCELLCSIWYRAGRYSEARQMFDLGCQAADKLGDSHALISMLIEWGKACIEQANYEKAQSLLENSLYFASSRLEDPHLIADSRLALSRVALELDNFSESEKFATFEPILIQELAGSHQIGLALNRLAYIGYSQGQFETALSHAEQGLNFLENLSSKQHQFSALNILTDICLEMKDVERAQHWLDKASDLADEIENYSQLPALLDKLSEIQLQKENFTAARKNADRSLNLFKNLGDIKSEANLLHQISRIERNRGDFSEALVYCEQSLALFTELDFDFGQCVATYNKAIIHQALGKPNVKELLDQAYLLAVKIEHDVLIGLISAMREGIDKSKRV